MEPNKQTLSNLTELAGSLKKETDGFITEIKKITESSDVKVDEYKTRHALLQARANELIENFEGLQKENVFNFDSKRSAEVKTLQKLEKQLNDAMEKFKEKIANAKESSKKDEKEEKSSSKFVSYFKRNKDKSSDETGDANKEQKRDSEIKDPSGKISAEEVDKNKKKKIKSKEDDDDNDEIFEDKSKGEKSNKTKEKKEDSKKSKSGDGKKKANNDDEKENNDDALSIATNDTDNQSTKSDDGKVGKKKGKKEKSKTGKKGKNDDDANEEGSVESFNVEDKKKGKKKSGSQESLADTNGKKDKKQKKKSVTENDDEDDENEIKDEKKKSKFGSFRKKKSTEKDGDESKKKGKEDEDNDEIEPEKRVPSELFNIVDPVDTTQKEIKNKNDKVKKDKKGKKTDDDEEDENGETESKSKKGDKTKNKKGKKEKTDDDDDEIADTKKDTKEKDKKDKKGKKEKTDDDEEIVDTKKDAKEKDKKDKKKKKEKTDDDEEIVDTKKDVKEKDKKDKKGKKEKTDDDEEIVDTKKDAKEKDKKDKKVKAEKTDDDDEEIVDTKKNEKDKGKQQEEKSLDKKDKKRKDSKAKNEDEIEEVDDKQTKDKKDKKGKQEDEKSLDKNDKNRKNSKAKNETEEIDDKSTKDKKDKNKDNKENKKQQNGKSKEQDKMKGKDIPKEKSVNINDEIDTEPVISLSKSQAVMSAPPRKASQDLAPLKSVAASSKIVSSGNASLLQKNGKELEEDSDYSESTEDDEEDDTHEGVTQESVITANVKQQVFSAPPSSIAPSISNVSPSKTEVQLKSNADVIPTTSKGKVDNDVESDEYSDDDDDEDDEYEDGDTDLPANAPRYYEVRKDWQGSEKGDLSIKLGDVVYIMRINENKWWYAKTKDDKKGYVPSTIITVSKNQNFTWGSSTPLIGSTVVEDSITAKTSGTLQSAPKSSAPGSQQQLSIIEPAKKEVITPKAAVVTKKTAESNEEEEEEDDDDDDDESGDETTEGGVSGYTTGDDITTSRPIITTDDDDTSSHKTLLNDFQTWNKVRKDLKKTGAGNVPEEFANLPTGFRVATLQGVRDLATVEYSNVSALFPKMSRSDVELEDIQFAHFGNSNGAQILHRNAKFQRMLLLQKVTQVPTLDSSIKIENRLVRICIFDGEKIKSNIHTVRATCTTKDPKTWNFNTKITDTIKSAECGEIFIRYNSNAEKLYILLEVCAVCSNQEGKAPTELSVGWISIPMYESNGQPVANKTFDMQLNGGSPYEQKIDVISTIPAPATPVPKISIKSNKIVQPKLSLKISQPTKDNKEMLDVLPDVLIGNALNIFFISYYRSYLAQSLFLNKVDLHNVIPVTSPFLVNFPVIVEQCDLMDILRSEWLEASKTLKKTAGKNLPLCSPCGTDHVNEESAILDDHLRILFLESVYPISKLANLPPYNIADDKCEVLRQSVIQKFQEKRKLGILNALLSPELQFTEFCIEEFGFKIISPLSYANY